MNEPGSATDDAPSAASALAPTTRYHAFISYSHADSDVVRAIQSFIEDYGLPAIGAAAPPRLRLFRDETDIRPDDLGRELNLGLYESNHLLVCVSPAALKSEWVAKEVAAFRALRPDALIPVLLEGGPAHVQRHALNPSAVRPSPAALTCHQAPQVRWVLHGDWPATVNPRPTSARLDSATTSYRSHVLDHLICCLVRIHPDS